MHYFIFPEKDATIYEDSIHQNTGLDQILELQKTLVHAQGDTPYNSRILIKFDLDTFSASYAAGTTSGSDMKYYLNLYTDEAIEIPLSYTVEVYPLSSSWEMGNGKRADSPITKTGVSWNIRDGVTISGVTGSAWVSSGSDYLSGSGYTQYAASQSFSFQTTDLHVDVTTTVNAWLSGSIPNHGFLIKRSALNETSSLNQGTLQFFSNETHTIFRPRLEAIWKDASFTYNTTSSISQSISSSAIVNTKTTNPIIGYSTYTFYTGSGISGSGTGYVTQSGSPNTWVSRSYSNYTASIYSYTSSLGLYHSSSVAYVYTTASYDTWTSASITWLSGTLSRAGTVSNFYTRSLGSEFLPSATADVSYSLAVPGYTASAVWVYNTTAGYYYSSSITALSASYTWTSSSLSQSVSQSTTTTQLMYPITDEDFVVWIPNLYNEYKQNAKVRFRVKARERYPRKTFVTESWSYTRVEYFLPTQSYYEVRDGWNEVQWMPFSSYTQLSVDKTGSYFDLNLDGLEPERLYRIAFKVVQGSIERVIDNDYMFRIIR